MKRAWPAELDDPDPEVQLRRTRLALETVIARIRPATWFYPVMLAGYLFLVWGSRVDAAATGVALGLEVVLAVIRFVLYRRTAAARDRDPDRWRARIGGLSASVMFIWDALLAFEVWQRDLDASAMVLVTASLVMRASGTYAASPDLRVHHLWSRWSRLPLAFVPIVLPTRDGAILAVSFISHALYSEAQCRQLNAEFWRRIVATDSLAAAHADLRREVAMRERAEVELRLAQKLESVGRLAAGIAHEINSPLQALSGNLAFVGDGIAVLLEATHDEPADREPEVVEELAYLTENLPDSLRRARGSLERAAEIVRSVRTFAQPSATTKSRLDINQALDTTLEVARHECTAAADVVTDFGALPPVEGYAGELNQVFLNIIVNAAHAIAATGKRGALTITTRSEGSHVRVAISDTGVGIPDAIKDAIFDPFFTTKDVGKGMGQGLAIAHAVVTRRHGGELTFVTEVGHGTTFTIRLPVRAVTAAAA